jgi:hypothetical protein
VRQKSPTAFIKNKRIFCTTTTWVKRGRAGEKNYNLPNKYNNPTGDELANTNNCPNV